MDEVEPLLNRLRARAQPPNSDRSEEVRRGSLVRQLASRLGRRYSPSRCSLDTFQTPWQPQSDAISDLRGFEAILDENVRHGRSLLFYGTVGTGKDHLLAAMLYSAARSGFETDWHNCHDLFGQFRDLMDGRERESSLLRRLARPDVLGLSDLIPPVGNSTAWRSELLLRILDLRYRECRPTWATMNAASPEDAEESLSAPVFDRLRDDALMVPCFWPSFRVRR